MNLPGNRSTLRHAEWWRNPAGVAIVTSPFLENLNLLASVNADSHVELYVREVDSSLCFEGALDDDGEAKWLVAKNWENQELIDGPRFGALNPPMITYPMQTDFDDLHIRFAALEKESDIARFASRHGFLEKSLWGVRVECEDAIRDESTEFTFGESLAYWKHAIRHVQILVDLSRCLRAKASEDQVRKFVHSDGRSAWLACELWQKDDLNLVHLPIQTKVRMPDEIVEQGRNISIRRAATTLLEKHMNYALGTFASARIRFDPAANFSLVPTCLLGAIYLHLAREMMGHSKPPVLCAGCGRWIQVQTGKKRHCDDRCKQMAYRRRKENAQTKRS